MFSEHRADSAEHITNRRQISSILRRLHQEHPLLIAHFPDNEQQTYSSTLLAVDAPKGFLSLDELNPAAGHKRISQGTVLLIQGWLEGVDVRFSVRIAEVHQERGIYFYRAELPNDLLYHQRRSYLRVPIAMAQETMVDMVGSDKTIRARMSDISIAGFGGVILEGDTLAPGDHFHCSFALGSDHVTARAEVRFIVDDAARSRFGARFEDLSPGPRRHIERTVMQLQRELARTDYT